MLKRIIKKILSSLNASPQRKLPTAASLKNNIIDSKVDNLELIDPSSIIQYSVLQGSITVGASSVINRCWLAGTIKIGSNTTINGPFSEFYSIDNPITIGNFCSIARGTNIQEHNHNTECTTTYFIKYRVFNEKYGADVVTKGAIEIGNDVWVASGCTILSGVKIGNGCVIAANSVVNSDVPPYSIVGGTPARVLKKRFSDVIIEKLEEIQWWNWDIEKIKANKELFYGDLTMEKLLKIK